MEKEILKVVWKVLMFFISTEINRQYNKLEVLSTQLHIYQKQFSEIVDCNTLFRLAFEEVQGASGVGTMSYEETGNSTDRTKEEEEPSFPN